MELTLLGTGIPLANPHRRGTSQLIEAGNEAVLVDCGAGTAHRLIEAGYAAPYGPPRRQLQWIALTHLHSDHITGLADVLWAGWVGRWWQRAPKLVGPLGTAEFITDLMRAFKYDIAIRTAGERLSREALVPEVVECDEGWMVDGDGWQLGSFRVDHAPVDEAFGYRLDADEGSIAISGDTRPAENLVRQAQGVDLLVHEVYWRAGIDALRASTPDEARRRSLEYVAGYHTPSDAVGRIAAEANARHLVLGHIILPGGTPDQLAADAKAQFRGQVTVGEDLQTFPLTRRT